MINDKNFNELKRVAALFDALGHYRRVLVFKVLQESGTAGMNFGRLSQLTKIGETNLAHHIRMMKKGGIVDTRTAGRETILTLNIAYLTQSWAFLKLQEEAFVPTRPRVSQRA